MRKIILVIIVYSLFTGCNPITENHNDSGKINDEKDETTTQMPEAIYDRTGMHIGWIFFSNHIYNDNATTRLASIQNTMVHNVEGIFVGYFENGYFRDKNGNAVAFISEAKGVPSKPLFSKPPLPQLPQIAPLTPLKPLQPIVAYTPFWSELSWENFIKGW